MDLFIVGLWVICAFVAYGQAKKNLNAPLWAVIGLVFGVFVDSNRADDVISYGVGAGALVVGLAIFAYATRQDAPSGKANKTK